MNPPGQHSLAGPALALDQDNCVACGNAAGLLENRCKLGVRALEHGFGHLAPDLFFEVGPDEGISEAMTALFNKVVQVVRINS